MSPSTIRPRVHQSAKKGSKGVHHPGWVETNSTCCSPRPHTPCSSDTNKQQNGTKRVVHQESACTRAWHPCVWANVWFLLWPWTRFLLLLHGLYCLVLYSLAHVVHAPSNIGGRNTGGQLHATGPVRTCPLLSHDPKVGSGSTRGTSAHVRLLPAPPCEMATPPLVVSVARPHRTPPPQPSRPHTAHAAHPCGMRHLRTASQAQHQEACLFPPRCTPHHEALRANARPGWESCNTWTAAALRRRALSPLMSCRAAACSPPQAPPAQPAR